MEKNDRQKGNRRYESVNGLRAYSALGIVLLHVYSNGEYHFSFVSSELITYLANLVFLFMMLSGFSMCCGYYDKILNGTITPDQFYKKRYSKIWPFFASLCFLDLLLSPSIESVYEVFANLTLCFGLLPNPDIQVIGVSWTLGVIFVFYMLFPFFCFLLSNNKRAWLSLSVATIFNYLCSIYFFNGDHMPKGFFQRGSFLFCAVYFLAGGMIYLYRSPLGKFSRHHRSRMQLMCLAATGVAFIPGIPELYYVFLLATYLVYALGNNRRILKNRFTRFLSDVSMEIYLCHMVVFRVLEKLKLLHILPWDIANFLLTFILTTIGAVIVALMFRWAMYEAPAILNKTKRYIPSLKMTEGDCNNG